MMIEFFIIIFILNNLITTKQCDFILKCPYFQTLLFQLCSVLLIYKTGGNVV